MGGQHSLSLPAKQHRSDSVRSVGTSSDATAAGIGLKMPPRSSSFKRTESSLPIGSSPPVGANLSGARAVHRFDLRGDQKNGRSCPQFAQKCAQSAPVLPLVDCPHGG